ncbi:MAG: alpha/beta hydrolase, partial [Mesorhizobium sp.]
MADVLSSQVGSRRVDTNRVALNVRESGTGPLMLFFHGITSNS